MEDQNFELQLRKLKAAGCEQAFQDQVSGSVVKRPGLDQALAVVGQRGLLVVWRLDRLGRSLPHLIELPAPRPSDRRGWRLLLQSVPRGPARPDRARPGFWRGGPSFYR